MDVNQRFLRRQFLLENIEMWLAESIYHRKFDVDEDLEHTAIWTWDELEGSNADSL